MSLRSLPFLLALGGCAAPHTFPGADRIPSATQHVVVMVERESDSTGLLLRYERRAGPWAAVGAPVRVNLGVAGVAKTREGDRRAPTGAYPLTTAFGYAPAPPSGLRMPYLALRPETECVDDADSPWYNRIVNPSELASGTAWASAEMMRRDIHHGDQLYRLGLVVAYNPQGGRDPESGKGAGSCIFLHVERGPDRPTVGCTSMPEDDLLTLLRWLDPDPSPLLIQGTRADLEALARAGRLPYAVPHRPAPATSGQSE